MNGTGQGTGRPRPALTLPAPQLPRGGETSAYCLKREHGSSGTNCERPGYRSPGLFRLHWTVCTPCLHRVYTVLYTMSTLCLHRVYTISTPCLHRVYTVLTLCSREQGSMQHLAQFTCGRTQELCITLVSIHVWQDLGTVYHVSKCSYLAHEYGRGWSLGSCSKK